MSAEVRPGYKQTEVGVIPAEWEARTFRQICRVNQGLQVAIEDRIKYPTTTSKAYITIQFLNDRKSIEYINDYPPSACCSKDDVLMTRTGNTGIVVSGVEGVFHNNFFKINFDRRKLDRDFLVGFLSLSSTRKVILEKAGTSTIPDLNHGDFYSIYLPLPPLPEQRAIATALSDVDGLLGGLDRLIAKKRDLKQAAMQQLLTGQTRLPGFHDEWKVKRLGEVGKFLKGSGVTKDQTRSGTLACVRYGELYTLHNDVVRDYQSWISPEVAATAVRLKQGDILFAGSGETKEEIGKCAAFVSDIEAYAGGDIVILRLDESDSRFLGYYLNTGSIARQKASRGQGDAVVHISSSSLSDVLCKLPPLPEQTAIAEVLTEMDAELAGLEQRREKTRALKQAMMQELLTGRTRLFSSGSATITEVTP